VRKCPSSWKRTKSINIAIPMRIPVMVSVC
jgi:hypothetical protein